MFHKRVEKKTEMQRIKSELAKQGLRPADLPAALVVHEILGAAMAAGFWAACYVFQPSTTALAPLARSAAARHPALARSWEASLAAARARVAKSTWIRTRTGADPARLTLALADSLVARAALKPATFVFKLWASAAAMRAGKRAVGGLRRRNGEGGRVACVTLAAGCGGLASARAVRRPCPWERC
jgi:hypothetical protein